MNWLITFSLAAMMPGSDVLPSVKELGLDTFVVQFRRDASWVMWMGMLGSTAAFVCLPIVTVFWPLPAFLLPASVLDRHAHAMAMHRFYLVRQAAVLLKMVAGLHWAAQPQVRAHFGLPPYREVADDWRTD